MNVILRYAFAFIFSGKGFGNSDKKGETVNLRKIFRLKKPRLKYPCPRLS